MNYAALLKNIITSRRLKLFNTAKILGVSIIVLQDFLAGMPVKDAQEQLIIEWIEGVI